MKVATRIAWTLLCGVAILYFVFWFGNPRPLTFYIPPWISVSVSLLAAAGVAWYVWMHTASSRASFAHSFLLGGVVGGGIGFSAGFFGPLLFPPSGGVGVGPVMGMLTGLLGCILGAALGGIRWYARQAP